jgi:hypothetical protein
MLNLRAILWAGTLVVPVLTYTGETLACGQMPCAQLNEVQPSDGSTNVPTNTEIRLLYFGEPSLYPEDSCYTDQMTVRLVPTSGAQLELTTAPLLQPQTVTRWLVARPTEPLAANTEYSIQLELGPGRDPCGCNARDWVSVGTFTTGAGVDEGAPEFAGITRLSYGERVDHEDICGNGGGALVPATPTFEPASDDSPLIRYDVYVNGELDERFVQTPGGTQVPMSVNCASSAVSTLTALTPGSLVEVRAVDLAGNSSGPNQSVLVEDVCAPVPPTKAAACAFTASPATARGAWGVWAALVACGVRSRRRFFRTRVRRLALGERAARPSR